MPNIKNSLLLASLILSQSFLFSQGNNTITDPSSPYDLPKSFFENNRNVLRSKLKDRSVALFFSASEKIRSNDVLYDFHQDPNFYYLTGFNEPNALLIIFKEPLEIEGDTFYELMFVPGRSLEYERWNGIRLGTVGVREKLGFEKVLTNTAFPDFFIDFSYFDQILFSTPDGAVSDDSEDRGDIYSLIKHFNFKTDTLELRKDDKVLNSMLALMREIKDPREIQLIQRAIDITCESQKELMKKLDENFTEFIAESEIEYVFRKSGASGPGFPSIVGGAQNTCILHYVSNQDDLKAGDLLVVDVGAEYQNYTADITRTMPVSGKFTEHQAQVYSIVLAAQKAGIEKCRKGNKFWDPHDAATETIQKGLKDLGIIKKAYESRKYFMHGTSHYLGLDVHDAGSYQPLRKGNVITVEPGIYIPAGSDCDEKWWNIGIRIEDDILITDGNPEILSDCVPREIQEIEKLME